jgi:hypothetical protein
MKVNLLKVIIVANDYILIFYKNIRKAILITKLP